MGLSGPWVCRAHGFVGFVGPMGLSGPWVCGFVRVAGCELRIAFKGVAFLRLILSDIDYYQIIVEGLIIKGLII